MSSRYVPPSILGAGVIVIGLVGYFIFSAVVGNPASFESVAAPTADFRITLWIGRALDVLVQGALVLSGVMGVVALLRGIRV
ncbi:MAG TPA: hypothetical protein DEA47_03370 [Peptococcaceae bacterium]|nr:MAG: hypothetical protein XD50_0491 [Clostridia bacterium 41_269]HBT20390.1 hypothetical protein [Peptococcaceae bacterium]